MIGSSSVVAWVMLTGLVITLPPIVAEGVPEQLDRGAAGWLALSGLGNVAGLLIVYTALRIERVSIVAPINSTEGAVAALIAAAAGEAIAQGTGLALAVIAVGVVLAGIVEDEHKQRPNQRGVLLALIAAVAFGVGLYSTGRAGQDLPVIWAVLPARLVGVIAVTLPLAFASRLRLTRQALPLVVTSGLAEVIGFSSFALGARHGIAVTSVLASQFATVASVGAYVLFHERLGRVQLVGVVMVLAGVAALSALQT
jgi:drug/metabolite transporter (DMT)-like permease